MQFSTNVLDRHWIPEYCNLNENVTERETLTRVKVITNSFLGNQTQTIQPH